jgi:hypothetical protein
MLLKQLADPARDVTLLTYLVVAGPESESAWSLFQEDEGRGEERRQDGQQGGGSEHSGFEDSESVMEVDMSLLQDRFAGIYMKDGTNRRLAPPPCFLFLRSSPVG